MNPPRGIATAILTAAIGVSTVGCASLSHAFTSTPSPDTGASASAAECGQVLKPAPMSRQRAATVILVDRSASTVAHGATAVSPDWFDKLQGLLPADPDDVVSIGAFGGSAEPIWPIAHEVTPIQSSSSQRQIQAAAVIASCFKEGLQQAVRATPDSAGTNILQAISSTADRFQAYPAASEKLIIATDGLNNLGCLNLSTAAVGEPGAITAITAACKSSLPDLAGVNVLMLGVGHPASDQPPLSVPQVQWLTQLWTSLCQAMRAKCSILPDIDTVQGGQPAASSVSDTAVKLPQISVRVRGKQLIFTIPQSILFATDSAQVSPGAGSALATVVQEIRRRHYTAVNVIGYTDARGSDAYNLNLSLHRADTVARVLETGGISAVEAAGMGKADPACAPEYNAGGTPNLQNMACDRRVEIVVHLS